MFKFYGVDGPGEVLSIVFTQETVFLFYPSAGTNTHSTVSVLAWKSSTYALTL